MNVLKIVLIGFIALLSLAAGLAKIGGAPQEIEFLSNFGFSHTLILAYGTAQVLGGMLLAFPKTIRFGAVLSFLCFVLSTLLIFSTGNIIFSLVSLIPVALCVVIYWISAPTVTDTNTTQNIEPNKDKNIE